MTELTQQSYILAQQREEVQAHAVRKVHQKQVDKAMEVIISVYVDEHVHLQTQHDKINLNMNKKSCQFPEIMCCIYRP